MPGGPMGPTTADSQRPYTSAGGRPTTSAGGFDRDPQYTYSQEWTVEEEDSDVEDDLFAFGPPSTADERGNPRQEFQQQQQQLYAQQFAPTYEANPQQQAVPAARDHGSSPAPAYPSPTFDPNARYPADAMAASQAALVSFPPSGPSSPLPEGLPSSPITNNPYDNTIPIHTASTTSHPSVAYHNLNQGPYVQPHTYDTPPHTVDSEVLDNDPYRMRNISSKNEHGIPTTATTHPGTATTNASSREVRVSLPSGHGQHEKDLEAVRETPKRLNTGSIDAESMSIGPSMLEDYESREGSIK